MAEMFYDDDADLALIQGKNVAVIGYGSQGHAHALSLRDSGVDVRVGLQEGSRVPRQGRGRGAARPHPGRGGRGGRRRRDPRARPGPAHPLRERDRAAPRRRATPWSSATASTSASATSPRPRASTSSWSRPRAPATWSAASTSTAAAYPSWWRSRRTSPGTAWDLALSYAKAIGGLRAGGIRTTFAEETETDLFGEQAVLCGGASQLVMYGFETLIEAGYQPEVAYFECLHELKLIVDLMYEGGIAKQRWSVSDTAEYGDYVSGPRVITPAGEGEHADDPRRDQGRHLRRSGSSTTRTPAARSSPSCASRASSTRSSRPVASCAS